MDYHNPVGCGDASFFLVGSVTGKNFASRQKRRTKRPAVDLKYGPCPPARDFGSRVSGLVFGRTLHIEMHTTSKVNGTMKRKVNQFSILLLLHNHPSSCGLNYKGSFCEDTTGTTIIIIAVVIAVVAVFLIVLILLCCMKQKLPFLKSGRPSVMNPYVQSPGVEGGR